MKNYVLFTGINVRQVGQMGRVGRGENCEF